jgi:dienelactone hydrolase
MLKIAIVGFLGAFVFLSGCCHLPQPLHPRSNANEEKMELLRSGRFERNTASVEDRKWEYLVTGSGEHSVVLLHEMPAMGPEILELAERLAGENFTVFVPLMFGQFEDDPNRYRFKWLRPSGFVFGRPAWKAQSNSERRITRQLHSFCTDVVLQGREDSKLGVVGMCVTGILPLQLLGQEEELPGLKAIVLAQPTMPLISFTSKAKKSVGISEDEFSRAKARVDENDIQVIGFRFEEDCHSPPERFDTLRRSLGDRFIDATVPSHTYVTGDHLTKRAHAVLTSGYSEWHEQECEPGGHFAYRQLRDYLRARLMNGSVYVEPVYNVRD